MPMTFEQFGDRYESLFWERPGADQFMAFKFVEAMLGHPLPSDITGRYLRHIGLYTFADVLSVNDLSCFNPNFNVPFWFRHILHRFIDYIDQDTIWPELRWLFMFEGRNRDIPAHDFLTPDKFYQMITPQAPPQPRPPVKHFDSGDKHCAHVMEYRRLREEVDTLHMQQYEHVQEYHKVMSVVWARHDQHCAHVAAYNRYLKRWDTQLLIDAYHASRLDKLQDDYDDLYLLPPRKHEHKHLFHRFKDGGKDFCGSGYDPAAKCELRAGSTSDGFASLGDGCGWRLKARVQY